MTAPRQSPFPVSSRGTRLAGTLVHPRGRIDGLLVIRTPYDRSIHLDEARAWARRGVSVLLQDVRGRYGSSGRWVPYRHERTDGEATLRALTEAFPGVPIAVGGGSYAAGCARALAGDERVRAVLSFVPALSLHQTVLGREGVPQLQRHAWWWTVHGVGRRSRPNAFTAALARTPGLLDLTDPMDLEAALDAPGFARALEDARHEAPAPALPPEVPRLELGGWWDPFVDASWDDGVGNPTDPQPGPAPGVTIGPWAHDLDGRRAVGSLPPVPGGEVGIGELQSRWLRSALRGEPERVDAAWVGDGWLPATSAPAPRVYTATPSGRLIPAGERVPTTPGPELDWTHDPASGLPGRCWPVDVADDAGHPDCLRFLAEAVRTPTRVLGRFAVTVVVHTRDPVTGPVVARVSVRRADGSVIPLAQGVHPGVGAGGGPAEVCLDTRPAGSLLRPGEALVLDLAGGAAPLHPRAPHTVRRALDPARTRLTVPLVTGVPTRDHPWKEPRS